MHNKRQRPNPPVPDKPHGTGPPPNETASAGAGAAPSSGPPTPQAPAFPAPPPLAVTDLPPEILQLVLAHLAPHDVKNLASTGSLLRRRLLPHLMQDITLSWAQLLALHKTTPPAAAISHFRHHVRQIRISPANAYNEYQMDTFGQLLSPSAFPALRSVVVHSLNSSYWLKYNACAHVSELTLCSDPVAPTSGTKNFHLSHVAGLSRLRRLSLHNYHFSQPEPGENTVQPSPAIASLELHDCTWEYPFSLSSFNPAGHLRSLVLTLSKDNSFVLSERFVDFLKTPFSNHPASLRHLRISFEDPRYKSHLTSGILVNILTTFSALERLELHGWSAYLAVLRDVVCNHQFKAPFEFGVKLVPSGSMSMEKFLDAVAGHPNLHVRGDAG